jgi:large subunit ribosomal protein L54
MRRSHRKTVLIRTTAKSKKSRRLAAKRQRKMEEKMLASGNSEALAPKVPITAQSIDLPANEEGSVQGALEADGRRGEVRKAMRVQRRKDIKERNFLGSM